MQLLAIIITIFALICLSIALIRSNRGIKLYLDSRKYLYICLSGLVLILLALLLPLEGVAIVTFQDVIMKNTVNYLNCDQYPSLSQAESVYQKHIDVIQKIKQHADVEFIVTTPREYGVFSNEGSVCNCKGELYTMTCCESKRQKTLKIINSKKFFGIPYTIINN